MLLGTKGFDVNFCIYYSTLSVDYNSMVNVPKACFIASMDDQEISLSLNAYVQYITVGLIDSEGNFNDEMNFNIRKLGVFAMP